MPVSDAAMRLNDFFSGYDHAILSLMHSLASGLGGILTPIMSIITLLGEKGLVFFLLAFIFLLFADTRDTGVCVFGAVCCGALITNVILKDSVARPRPFESSTEFYAWWQFVGAPAEDGFSFPSGHVTACAAGMTALCNMKGRKLVLPSVIIVLLMAVSRNYLMAHYPSDVLVAAVIGVFSGFVAWFITQFIFRFLRRRRYSPVCELLLDFDLHELLPSDRRSGSGIGAFFKSLGGHLHGIASKPAVKDAGEDGDFTDDELFIDEDSDMKTYSVASSAGSVVDDPPAAGRRVTASGRGGSAREGRHSIAKTAAAEPENEKHRKTERSFSVNDLANVAKSKPVPAGRHEAAERTAKNIKSARNSGSKRPPAPKLRTPGSYKGKHEL